MPFIIDDDLQVTGSLSAGSIAGLTDAIQSAVVTSTSNLVEASDLSQYAKVSDLNTYAKTSDLSQYATTSDLADYATVTTVNDVANDVGTVATDLDALYQYNRCVVNLSQSFTNPYSADLLFCWTIWIGTDPSLTTPSLLVPGGLMGDSDVSELNTKLQAEADRALKRKVE
jgi:hypothetical protein